MLVGAGTVLSAEQASRPRLDAGADFAVAPGTNAEVVGRVSDSACRSSPASRRPRRSSARARLGRITWSRSSRPRSSAGPRSCAPSRRPIRTSASSRPADRRGERSADYLAVPSVVACGGSWIVRPRARARGAVRRDRAPRARGARTHELPARPCARPSECRCDLVSLGEVMLRLDPGEGRIATTRPFRVWEGGGEYNVARGLKRCFGLRTAIVTALADNPVGRLVEDLIYQGGVDRAHLGWVPFDGVGRAVRNGLNFTERGFGVRGAVGVSDRGHTAVSQLRPARSTGSRSSAATARAGSTAAASSPRSRETTAEVAREAMEAARRHGTVVSYDLNYRPSLWKSIGGPAARGRGEPASSSRTSTWCSATRRTSRPRSGSRSKESTRTCSSSTSRHTRDCSSRCWRRTRTSPWSRRRCGRCARRPSTTGGRSVARATASTSAPRIRGLEIFDRVGGGDSFASGLFYGLLDEPEPRAGARLRRRARRARDDDAGRHLDGDARRGRAPRSAGGSARVQR